MNAEKLFGTLAHITTSQIPQSRLLTMLGDSRFVGLESINQNIEKERQIYSLAQGTIWHQLCVFHDLLTP